MARKVFISVLGTGYYSPVRYTFVEPHENDAQETHFVQQATIRHYCTDWKKGDVICIFLTPEARKSNWNNPAQVKNWNNKEPYVGLSETLSQMELQAEICAIDITNGNDESEIWGNFKTIYDSLKTGDELYFDITHGFRSIPTLVMVLANYAKLLKGISVSQITYGNFEARNNKANTAPVVDITSLSVLQDWTNAANEFLNNGSFDSLVTVLEKKINPILKETRGGNIEASALQKLKRPLTALSKQIQTCRGMDIETGAEAKNVQNLLISNKNSFIQPLNPILERIGSKIYPFMREREFDKSMAAVNWCIEYKLYQQAITLLQEAIVTYICDELKFDRIDESNRNIINSCFRIASESISESNWTGEAKANPEITKMILKDSEAIKLIYKQYSSLTDLRNDINHAGWRKKSSPTKSFLKIKELYCDIISKL